MAKNILVVQGSPRKNGNSAALAKRLAKGAEEAGAQVETLYLNGLHITPCQGCGTCRKPDANGCVIEDNMGPVYDKLRQADALVIATPVYWFTMSAQTKAFIDRFYALGADGYQPLPRLKFAFLLSYAASDAFSSGAVNAMRAFQDMCRYLGAEIAGFVHGSAAEPGAIEARQNLMDEAYQLGRTLAAE